MKKLMIAAAAAAMSAGAFAVTCGLEDATDCAEVYDVSMSLKTTKCNILYVKAKAADKCGLGGQAAVCECYRDLVTKKIKGVIYACTCSCTEGTPSTLLIDPVQFTLSCGDDFVQDGQLFWIAKDKVILNDLMTFTHLVRIGKTNQKVEASGTFGPLTFAGSGSYDNKNSRVKSISGNVAGLWLATYDCATDIAEGGAAYCKAFELCEDIQAETDLTVAYGNFSVKYNAGKSKKLAAGRKNVCNGSIIPKAVLSYGVIGSEALPNYYCAE